MCAPPAPHGGKTKHKSSRIQAAIGANECLLTFLRGALQISTRAASPPRGPAAWVAQEASQLLSQHFDGPLYLPFHAWNPTALHRSTREHSLSSNTAQCMCRSCSSLARPPASHRRGSSQPSSKIKAVSTSWSQEQPQVSLLHPLFCCLCQPLSSISLCLLCPSQH